MACAEQIARAAVKGHVHVAVAVNVKDHVNDHDNVNVNDHVNGGFAR